jgi:hypothetical protein
MIRALLLVSVLCLVAVAPVLVIAADKKSKEDPAATKLLADATAARAVWKDFPGFTADGEVYHHGRSFKANIDVGDKGKVEVDFGQLKLVPEEEKEPARNEAKETLASIVGHRFPPDSDKKTPCKFAEVAEINPFGKLIEPLDDAMGSSYRIRDKQILEVNRQMKDSRFTISVMENRQNEDKLYLPVSYVVNFWDVKTDALTRSVTYHLTWVRVDKFDLPETADVVTASAGKQVEFSLRLSKHKLTK